MGDDLDDALQRADQALYRAKRDGRNRCCGGVGTSMPELRVGEQHGQCGWQQSAPMR